MSMSSPSLNSPLIIINPRKSEKIIRSSSIPPEKITSLSTIKTELNQCPVCQNNSARYTCPRCSSPYCSAQCYKKHGTTCTESFYRGRVSQIWKLDKDDGDAKAAINDIIQREAETRRRDEEDDDEMAKFDDELCELAELIDAGDLLEEDDLSPQLKKLFEKSIHDGSLSHIVEAWVPWWMHDYTAAGQDCDNISSKPLSCPKEINLDEIILQIPPFIHKTTQPLQYNTIDILHATALAFRLYNGDMNQDGAEAWTTILYSCSVLKDDQRYGNVRDVLINCSQRCTHARKLGMCNVSWDVLVEDVLAISRNWRFVVKALLSTSDVFREGQKNSRKKSEKKKLHKMEKKVNFYISWCKKYWREIAEKDGLLEEIQAWMDERNLDKDLIHVV